MDWIRLAQECPEADSSGHGSEPYFSIKDILLPEYMSILLYSEALSVPFSWGYL